jgi:sigma-B regulation protein RsbU (phosphoserine phosphatase)
MVIERPDRGILRVLLVEDEPGDAYLVKCALNMSSSPVFAVTHVDTLAAAIELVQSGTELDVVLLDLSLPDSSGLSTVSRMQAVSQQLPVVIMTGLDDPSFAAQALEVGAQDFLVKSDDPERTVGRAIRYAITRMNAQIEREALLERLATQQRRLLQEVTAARAMQFDLLPRPQRLDHRLDALGLEVESFFEPSSGIGGDLWGCMECGNGRLSFYTFDFSGHGIGAALNVFRLHALIGDRWDPNQSPAEMLRALGSSLHGLLGRGQYATMVLCTVDTLSGELEWSSAGAPAPIMVHEGKVSFLDSRGIPLGLTSTAQYTNHRMAFPPGASLMLYSDAITDAMVDDEQIFGGDRLAVLANKIMARDGELRVETFLESFYPLVQMPLEDDLTAVRITRLAG